MKFLGDIAFAPKRGAPPPAPDGYENVPEYPFMYRVIMPYCTFRTTKDCDCPRKSSVLYCNYYDTPVTRSRCKDCGGKNDE